MVKKLTIPGVVRPTDGFRSTDQKKGPKPIEAKRAMVIRSIERHRRGEPRAYNLEHHDPALDAPVIRVLYGAVPLSVFEGKPAAVIDPKVNRDQLWDAIIARVHEGEFDTAIEEAAQRMLKSIRDARQKKQSGVTAQ